MRTGVMVRFCTDIVQSSSAAPNYAALFAPRGLRISAQAKTSKTRVTRGDHDKK
jgi:hypothetical protein